MFTATREVAQYLITRSFEGDRREDVEVRSAGREKSRWTRRDSNEGSAAMSGTVQQAVLPTVPIGKC